MRRFAWIVFLVACSGADEPTLRYDGELGQPIAASLKSEVFFVDTTVNGAGLVTGYLHLSEQLVAQGDTVEAGQTIGRIGATGRVTGPHLHWIVRYGPHSVDGRSLLDYNFEF